jgi:hypothetical protein
MAKNQDDALQILEQILPYFQPDYTVTIKEVENIFRSDQPFVLQSVGLADDYEGDFATRRVIIYTLDFETKVNFYGGVGSQGIIKTVHVDYNSRTSVSEKPLERQNVFVQPESAAITDAHTIVNAIFQPNDPDRVIFTLATGAVPIFTVGETISANNSGATAVLVSQVTTVLTCKNVNGIFNTTDTLSGGTSSSTSAITKIEELWDE